jgi:hypothetical protein
VLRKANLKIGIARIMNLRLHHCKNKKKRAESPKITKCILPNTLVSYPSHATITKRNSEK